MKNDMRDSRDATFDSLLDVDLYKLTMQQLAFLLYQQVGVEFNFINRTKTIKLPAFFKREDLERELVRISQLRFSREEIEYLRDSEYTRGLFCDKYLRFLAELKLPLVTPKLSDDGVGFIIRPQASWPVVTLWETLIMNAVNRLYFLALCNRDGRSEVECWAEGEKRLADKIAILKENSAVRFVDFGTRRRWSPVWQSHVLDVLTKQVPQNLLGTSNVYLAKKLDLRPIGTYAHEMDMVYQGIYFDDDERAGRLVSHEYMLNAWFGLYGQRLSIALVDTYGSDYFYSHFDAEQAREWRGSREDSGNPIVSGEKRIAYYERLGIDPREKELFPSDGLELPRMIEISRHFVGRIQLAFGWGTALMNDMGYDPISIVVKVAKANGHEVAKLSDNRAKATGDLQAVERLKRLANYDSVFNEACRY